MKITLSLAIAAVLAIGYRDVSAQTATTKLFGFFGFPFLPGVDLVGQTESSGMTWAAAGPAGPPISIALNNLTVPGLVPPMGNRARLAGVNGPAARIGLGTNTSTGTLYYSLALRVVDLGTLGTSGGTLAAFNNATGASTTLPAPLAARLLVRSAAGGYQLGLSKSSANAQDFVWAPTTFGTTDVVFAVAACEFNGGKGTMARLWVNPNTVSFGRSNAPAPTLSTSTGLDMDPIESFVLIQRPQPILPAVTFVDEVRVGTTWASVTPVPPDQFCTDFAQGLPAGTTAAGTTPPYVAAGVLHLTDAVNGQANFWTSPIESQFVQSLRAQWRTLIGGGGTLGADGLSFSLGRDLGTSFIPEEGAGSGLSVTIDTWDNGGTEVGLEIKWNGSRLAFTRVGDGTTEAAAPLRANQFFDVFLDLSLSGLVTFNAAGYGVSAQLPNYHGIEANQYVFAARTGGANDNHWIDDFCFRQVSILPAVVDLVTAANPAQIVVTEGDQFTQTIIVSNRGPSTATAVRLEVHFPPGGTLDALTLSQGTGQMEGTNLVAQLGTLAPGATVAVQFTAGTSDIFEGLANEFYDYCWWCVALEPDLNEEDNMHHGMVRVYAMRDFADAPFSATYHTLYADDGARHRLAGPYFGGSPPGNAPRDPDGDGMPSPNADGDNVGDGNNDEAGVRILDPLIPGSTTVQVQINAPLGGRVDGWIDFNGDHDWADPGERIFTSLLVPAGVSTYTISVPATALSGETYARFRISENGGLSDRGYANNGEAEDYKVQVVPGVDLKTVLGSVPSQLQEGNLLPITATVSNAGPSSATSVQLRLSIPTGTMLQSVSNDHGSCTMQGSNVTCSVNTLAAQQSFKVQAIIGVDAQFAAPIDSNDFFDVNIEVSVTAAEADLNPLNNVAVAAFIVIPNLDFGDARIGYPVTRAENGARHRNGAVFHLGPAFDREPNGVHSPNANFDDLAGIPDDEDGVVIPVPFVAGHTHPVTVTVPVPGFLDAFFDWNNDGDWVDPGERVTPPGGLLVVGPGAVPVLVTVPIGAMNSSPHARFRFSDVGGLGPTGFHSIGEVEDYPFEVRRIDFGDAPDVNYQTYLASGGPSHVIVAGEYLGLTIDAEPDGQPVDLDDGDEDGVTFPPALVPGTFAYVTVTASVAGRLDAWVDFNQNGAFDTVPGSPEPVCVAVPVVAGPNLIPINVPSGALVGGTWARFRFSLAGGLAPGGAALDGEVEDYGPGKVIVSGNNPNPVDLRVTLQGIPVEAEIAGQSFRYSVAVNNLGVTTASNVSLVVAHQGVIVSGLAVTGGAGCQIIGDEVRCAVSPLTAGQTARFDVTVMPQAQGRLQISARITSPLVDLHPDDNFADRLTPVIWNIGECACSCYADAPRPVPDPLLTSWFTKNSGQWAKAVLTNGDPARVYWNNGPTDPNPYEVFAAYADVQKIQSDGSFVYISGNGLASYDMGPWYCEPGNFFPEWPTKQTSPVKFPFAPDLSVCDSTKLDAIGLWVNGTAIYNLLDGYHFVSARDQPDSNLISADSNTPMGTTGVWNRDAWFSEKATFDPAYFHTAQHQYHSHASPLYLRAQLGDNLILLASTSGEIAQIQEQVPPIKHSPILGWAFDGHPIYGPYGYSSPDDPASGIRRMRSGYVRRDGANGTTDLTATAGGTGRTTLPTWKRLLLGLASSTLAPADYGPSTDRPTDTTPCNDFGFALGRYAEDNAYLGHLINPADGDWFHQGEDFDLDLHNGRCCKTPEFPNGTYAYFVTIADDTAGTPTFPYVLGWQYCGKQRGSENVTVPSGADTYFAAERPRFKVVPSSTFDLRPTNGLVTLQWDGRQGASYRLRSSDDLQHWTIITPPILSNGTTNRYSVPLGPNPPPHQYFDVLLERDGDGQP